MSMRALCVVILTAVLVPPVLGQVADEAAVPRISLADFKKALDAGRVMVVDVRDAGSYASGHLPGAVSIPLEALQQKLAALKASKKPIVTYCA